jgi:hypothetical protein
MKSLFLAFVSTIYLSKSSKLFVFNDVVITLGLLVFKYHLQIGFEIMHKTTRNLKAAKMVLILL